MAKSHYFERRTDGDSLINFLGDFHCLTIYCIYLCMHAYYAHQMTSRYLEGKIFTSVILCRMWNVLALGSLLIAPIRILKHSGIDMTLHTHVLARFSRI